MFCQKIGLGMLVIILAVFPISGEPDAFAAGNTPNIEIRNAGGFPSQVFNLLFRGKGNRKTAGKHTGMISGFEDNAEFMISVKGTPVGTIVSSLDKKGEYRRKFILTVGGQTVEMAMSAIPDKRGVWKTMEISNPAPGYHNGKA